MLKHTNFESLLDENKRQRLRYSFTEEFEQHYISVSRTDVSLEMLWEYCKSVPGEKYKHTEEFENELRSSIPEQVDFNHLWSFQSNFNKLSEYYCPNLLFEAQFDYLEYEVLCQYYSQLY